MTHLVRGLPRLLRRAPPSTGRPAKAKSGQAILELAAATTFILFCVLGIMDLGPALVRTAQLHAAVREGVAYGRTAPSDSTNIQDRVKKAVPVVNLTDANITITCYEDLTTTTKSCSGANGADIGDSIQVSATFTYSPGTALFQALFGSSFAITRSASGEIY